MDSNSQDSPPSIRDVTESEWNDVEQYDGVEHNVETDTYRASFDSSTESASMAVVSTVAAVAGTDPSELPPLYDAVDADALETLVTQTDRGASPSDVHVSFSFDGHSVTVHSYGLVTVQPPPGDAA